MGCSLPREEEATYYQYSFLFNEVDKNKSNLLVLWKNMNPPRLENIVLLDSGWSFEVGNPKEGLHTTSLKVTGEKVQLPHRISQPNHPLWYKTEIEIGSPGVLLVNADDGAQVFIDDKRIKSIGDNFFPLDTIGRLVLTVRVLNNAMFGGLQNVGYATASAYEKFLKSKQYFRERKLLVQKVLQKRDVTESIIKLAEGVATVANDENPLPFKELSQQLAKYPFLVGPYLIQRGDTLSIMVLSDSPKPIELMWGETAKTLTNKAISSRTISRFDLDLSKISGDLFYQVNSGQTTTGTISIQRKTGPAFSFNIWADSQSNWEMFAETIKLMDPENDVFGIGVGDLVGEGCDSLDWVLLWSSLAPVANKMPLNLIPGNHDYDGYYDDLKSENYYKYANSTPYQSWSYGNAAFIALDPNLEFPIGITKGSGQYDWFFAQLNEEKWKNATWRFVMLHQPPFSQGWEGYQGDEAIRKLLEPVFEEAKIDFVVSGHTHNYERWSSTYGNQKVTFLIVGGAGGTLEQGKLSDAPQMDTVIRKHHLGRFTINGDSIIFKAINHQGITIDDYQQVKF